MQERVKNPAARFPGALEALLKLQALTTTAGIPQNTLYMVQLRASQINGCSVCVDIHSRELQHAGESSERILTVAAWRDTPYFSGPERAALALAEAATRLAVPEPDEVSTPFWEAAARHYNEAQLSALVVAIAVINMFNRVNVTTRQISGEWTAHIGQKAGQAA